jgi:glycosyltransferase involved in cell wall biosynthesis
MTAGAKRILMLTHEFPPMRGGISRYAVELATAASQLGHSVTVLAPCASQSDAQSDASTFSFPVHRFEGEVYSSRHLLSTLIRTVRSCRAGDFDVVHALDRPHLYALNFMNRFVEQPYLSTVYGTELRGIATTRHTRWLGLRPIFGGCSRVCAISDFTRRLLFEECPHLTTEKTRITPLGVNQSWFDPAAPGIRQRLGIPEGHKIVLTVSRLDGRKGHRDMLASLTRLTPQLQKQTVCVIVGNGPDTAYNSELKRLASASPVPVILTGSLSDEDIRSLYAEATVFCMPGVPHPIKVEGFGLVYLEAAAQGLPAIGTNIGGVPEVVLSGKTGMIVNAGDSNALDVALVRMLADEDLRQTLGRNARAWAKQFTWERCVEVTYGGLK